MRYLVILCFLFLGGPLSAAQLASIQDNCNCVKITHGSSTYRIDRYESGKQDSPSFLGLPRGVAKRVVVNRMTDDSNCTVLLDTDNIQENSGFLMEHGAQAPKVGWLKYLVVPPRVVFAVTTFLAVAPAAIATYALAADDSALLEEQRLVFAGLFCTSALGFGLSLSQRADSAVQEAKTRTALNILAHRALDLDLNMALLFAADGNYSSLVRLAERHAQQVDEAVESGLLESIVSGGGKRVRGEAARRKQSRESRPSDVRIPMAQRPSDEDFVASSRI